MLKPTSWRTDRSLLDNEGAPGKFFQGRADAWRRCSAGRACPTDGIALRRDGDDALPGGVVVELLRSRILSASDYPTREAIKNPVRYSRMVDALIDCICDCPNSSKRRRQTGRERTRILDTQFKDIQPKFRLSNSKPMITINIVTVIRHRDYKERACDAAVHQIFTIEVVISIRKIGATDTTRN